MLSPLVSLSLSLWTAAAAASCQPADLGEPLSSRPAVLIVQTPGVSAEAYAAWAQTIEARRLDAWLLSCGLDAQDTDVITQAAIPAALSQLSESSGRPVALAGHSLGGTLAAISVADGHAAPAALALIGAPLRSAPTALDDWLAHRPRPQAPLHLGTLTEARWEDRPVLPLLLGEPLPPLASVSVGWLSTLRAWAHGALSVSLREATMPVWALSSGMDNVAPPERVRTQVPPGSFLRFGYLSFDGPDPEHTDLLLESPAAAEMARWLHETLR